MKTIMIIATLAFSSQIFAAPVCHLDITKNNVTERVEIALNEFQHPNADIPGYYINKETEAYSLSVLNADGNYRATLVVGAKTAEAIASDDDLVLELNSKGMNYLLNCPKYIY